MPEGYDGDMMIAGKVAPLVTSYVTSVTDNADVATYNFAGVSLGSAQEDRYILVAVTTSRAAAHLHNSLTIDPDGAAPAVAATKLHSVNEGNAGSSSSLWLAKVADAATGAIQVVFNSVCIACTIRIYRLTGLLSVTPFAQSSDNDSASPASLSLNVPDGGSVVAVVSTANGTRVTWSGLTEDYDADAGTAYGSSTASVSGAVAASPRAISCTNGLRACAVSLR